MNRARGTALSHERGTGLVRCVDDERVRTAQLDTDTHLAFGIAEALAAAGRLACLEVGAASCGTALLTLDGSTYEGWARLTPRRNRLAGPAERLRVRPFGRFDEDDNRIHCASVSTGFYPYDDVCFRMTGDRTRALISI